MIQGIAIIFFSCVVGVFVGACSDPIFEPQDYLTVAIQTFINFALVVVAIRRVFSRSTENQLEWTKTTVKTIFGCILVWMFSGAISVLVSFLSMVALSLAILVVPPVVLLLYLAGLLPDRFWSESYRLHSEGK